MTQKKGPDLFIKYGTKERSLYSRYEYCAKKSNSTTTLRRDETLRKSRRPKHQSDDIGALTTFLISTKNASFYSTFAKKSSNSTITLRRDETLRKSRRRPKHQSDIGIVISQQ